MMTLVSWPFSALTYSMLIVKFNSQRFLGNFTALSINTQNWLFHSLNWLAVREQPQTPQVCLLHTAGPRLLFEGTPVIFQEVICSSWAWPLWAGWGMERKREWSHPSMMFVCDSLSLSRLWPVSALSLPTFAAGSTLSSGCPWALRIPSSTRPKPPLPDLWHFLPLN